MVLGVGFGPVPFPATLLGGGAEQCQLSRQRIGDPGAFQGREVPGGGFFGAVKPWGLSSALRGH